MKEPVVVSFFTEGTLYEESAKILRDSCIRFQLLHEIEGIASRGTWSHNCAYKPYFLLQKLKQLMRPVVWVDADGFFQKSSCWELFSDCDIALRVNRHLHKKHSSYLMTGTIFVNPTPAALHLLEEWGRVCEEELQKSGGEAISCWDQVLLAGLLEKNPDLRIHPLPFPYIKVVPWDEGLVKEEETVIAHGQASRLVSFSLDAQKKQFDKKKKKWCLGGIIEYRPQWLRQIVDCCHSVTPFVRSLVVVMDSISFYTEEERRQFAFLARYFPALTFVELAFVASSELRLTLSKIFMEQGIERFLVLSADSLLNADAMLSCMLEEPRILDMAALLQPWEESSSEVNIAHHPLYPNPIQDSPPNLIRIDEKKGEQIEVALHLGLPLNFLSL